MHQDLAAAGLAVAGVSPQSPESHRTFRERYQLSFPLLADCHKAVARMYGVRGPLGIGIRRATFLIDATRTIQDAILSDFRIGKHEDFIRRALASGRGGR
jgi:peroxiredoxin Q/BCP